MQEKNNDKLLKKELKEKLDWYTLYASEEEYDEKAVEYILYLMDRVEPLKEGEIPPTEEARERFQKMDGNQKELLPLEKEVPMSAESAADKKSTELLSNHTDDATTKKERDSRTGGDNVGSNEGRPGMRKGKGKVIRFVLRYKAVVALLFLTIAIAVGGSIQAAAIRNDGFFFWLKRDETGTEMITSPKMLDGETGAEVSNIFYDRNDMPEWTQDWLEIEEKYEMPDNYEWQYFETMEYEFAKYVNGHYINKELDRELLLGVYVYNENVFYNKDRFANYNYVDNYEVEQKQMDVYCKEEIGEIFYAICFYEGNRKYSIRGQGELEELKKLANYYWKCVRNNL